MDSRPLPDASAMRRKEATALKGTMVRLPDGYRRVLKPRYWGGLSFVAMALELDLSPDAVRKLWYRALKRLQRELVEAAPARPGQPGRPA